MLLRAAIGPPAKVEGTLGVSGTVVDSDGRPVEGAEMTVFIEAGGTQRRKALTTDAGGRFHLPESIDQRNAIQGDRQSGTIRDCRFGC